MNVPERFGLWLMLAISVAVVALDVFIPSTVGGLEVAVWAFVALVAAWGLWSPRPPSP